MIVVQSYPSQIMFCGSVWYQRSTVFSVLLKASWFELHVSVHVTVGPQSEQLCLFIHFSVLGFFFFPPTAPPHLLLLFLLPILQIQEVQAFHRQVHRDGQRLRVPGRPCHQPQQRGGAAAAGAEVRFVEQNRRGLLEPSGSAHSCDPQHWTDDDRQQQGETVNFY